MLKVGLMGYGKAGQAVAKVLAEGVDLFSLSKVTVGDRALA